MDNWCILKGAANIDAAYNFINFILEPAVLGQGPRVPRLQHGITGVRELLPADTQFLDMVFFTPRRGEPDAPGALDNQDRPSTSTTRRRPQQERERAMTSTVASSPRSSGERALPKFGLALPASVWWVVFFVVPVVLVIAASFGSKVPNSAGRVSYSSLSFDNYREALSGGFDGTFFKVLIQGMRTTVLGTACAC